MNNNNMKASPVKSLENQFENLSITSFTSEDIIEIKDAIRNGMVNTRGPNNSIKEKTETAAVNSNTPSEIVINSSYAAINNLISNDNIPSFSTPSFDNFIKSFINEDTEKLDLSDPMNIIDEAYKKAKISKLKSIFLDEIKVDVKELIKSEIKSEINNFAEKQNESINKTIIDNLKSQVDFLKQELLKRDKIMDVLLYQLKQAFSSQMVNSSLQHQNCTPHNSESLEEKNEKEGININNNNDRIDVSDESIDINMLKSNLEDQLKTVRMNRHQEFLNKKDTIN